MTWVAGVDGCHRGWVAVLVNERDQLTAAPQIITRTKFEDFLALSPAPAIIAVDIPIGLLDLPQRGGRTCDRQARGLFGRPRFSSVFSPPARNQLDTGRGLSLQARGILPKIRYVDGLMTPELQSVLHEAHPELSFMAIVGHPMRFYKKKTQGRQERLRALEQAYHFIPGISEKLEDGLMISTRKQIATDDLRVAPDDLLDAYALAWTALHIAKRTAERVPPDPPIDRIGLRMEIWY